MKSFIEESIYFFLATADAEGRPDVSHKGGSPGFVPEGGVAPLPPRGGSRRAVLRGFLSPPLGGRSCAVRFSLLNQCFANCAGTRAERCPRSTILHTRQPETRATAGSVLARLKLRGFELRGAV